MPRIRECFLPTGFFCFLYWGITQFTRPATEHRALLTVAILSAGAGLLAAHWVYGKSTKSISRGAVFCGAAFFLLALLSATNTPGGGNAFKQLALYYSACLLALGFYSWFDRPTTGMVTGFLLALCMAHVLILVVVLGHASGVMPTHVEHGATVPYHGNIRHVAPHGLAAACAGLAIAYAGGRMRSAGYLFAAAAIFGLVFLGQRGGLLGLGVFVVTAAWFLPSMRRRIVVASTSILLIASGAVYVLDQHGITNRYAGSIIERVKNDAPAAMTGSSGRIALWKSSVELGLERPLLGNGPDGFRTSRIGREYPRIAQSHNLFLQAFVELGFPGLVLVVVAVWQLLRASTARLLAAGRAGQTDPIPSLLFAMVAGFLAESMVGAGSFYYGIPLAIFSLLVSLALAAIRDTDRPQ